MNDFDKIQTYTHALIISSLFLLSYRYFSLFTVFDNEIKDKDYGIKRWNIHGKYCVAERTPSHSVV